jgi:hypothetical protein
MSGAVGRGWATVELERAELEVREAVGPDLRFADAPRSALLGARCRRAEAPDGEWIVLLEPDMEGRLAGFLARHGEGWATTWERAAAGPDAAGAAGFGGPLGAELLARDQPARGPIRLVLTTATIEE